MTTPGQLGPNWRAQQIQYWRSRGYEAVSSRPTEILLFIIEGVDNLHDLADKSGLSASTVLGHVRRLTGLGLVRWTCKRGDPISPAVSAVVNVYDVLQDEPNGSCVVESTQLD